MYILAKDFMAGESINISSLSTASVEAIIAPQTAVTPSNINKIINETTITKVGLKSGTILTSDLLVDSEEAVNNDTREEELNMIVLPTYLKKNDYIDIRLTLPSGENYIVVTKKKIKDTNATTIWLDMSETEILTLSNAIVEAYQIEGSKLYANRFVEPGIQEIADVTYLPNSSVLSLISKNENIVQEAKTALAERYQRYIELRGRVNDAVNSGLETAQENVSSGVQTSIEAQAQQRADYLTELKSKQ